MEREQAIRFMHDLLRLMVARAGSDLFITAESPPAMKIDGRLARALMNERQADEFARTRECNFAIAPAGIGRFRVNAFVQQRVGMVLRVIPQALPTLDGLGLPPVLKEVALARRGLCLLVGGTGSGKSTTLAALVDWRNEHSFGHIVTIEDPVEFIHPHKNCVVTQREVGEVTAFKEAMRKGRHEGMQTFDQALFDLYEAGAISLAIV